MRKLNPKLITIFIIIGLIIAFFAFDLGKYLSLEYLQAQRQNLLAYYDANRFIMIAGYFICYIAVTALSLPGATIMTLAGASVFGVVTGTIVVSFASTIGATLAFLASRYIFRDYVQNHFGNRLETINEGIEKDGAFYLFTLRLVPLFPFFMINLLMGITPLKTARFFLISQIGMLPGTIVYVNAGDQLASLSSLSGILSPGLILSFALLGVFPLLAKKLVQHIKSKYMQSNESV